MLATIRYHVWRRLRAAYYAFALARLPFGGPLGRAISDWECAQGFGDSPKAKSTWDAEYGGGRWAYMGRQPELARYWTLIGFMDTFGRGGEYLDVGCGDGVLFERFKRLGYQRYVGIDISDVAIEKLRLYNDNRTAFFQADGDVHEPTGHFDVIVFNESLYYLRDPVRSLERYAESLKPGGFIIVSTYTESRRSLAVLREAKRAFEVFEEAQTTQGPMSWLCTVLKKAESTSLAR
ncbi:class I SAM-dependent methyltransferase [Bradyrhizobium sp. BRP22]|uniref:class I SAM-dependent methyltransferase n=1 Tax=Bradyrhizobium sp. BRP22 TaxID=2793821 RepID=UPI001CD60E33|nr:class I SAM-dependent methyltransferase [Bradyrhizobium sp. BRP22]MCA1453718.1 class I SAM-dependent methyltransferase [Bradyrhizobium sp. BRP22]